MKKQNMKRTFLLRCLLRFTTEKYYIIYKKSTLELLSPLFEKKIIFIYYLDTPTYFIKYND